MVSFTDVFVPGGYPRHTYNRRETLKLEESLAQVRQNLCKLVAVTGHTKSGKTVLVRSVLPREEAVWIDGGSVKDDNDFWSILLEQLDLFTDRLQSRDKQSLVEISGSGSADVDLLLAKGTGELGASYGTSRAKGEVDSRTASQRTTALAGLRNHKRPLVIDDFHYLPRDLQAQIVRALKALIFDGLPVVIIAIPHRRYDAVKVEREMTGRILQVQIPQWDEDELVYIPKTGFDILDGQINNDMCRKLADASIGSPHLMQEFCRELCRYHSVERTFSGCLVDVNDEALESVYRKSAEYIGRPIFEKIGRGPRQRTDRKQRYLQSGGTVDIYGLVLHAMASLKPKLETLEYEQLRSAIRDVSAQDIPQLQEIARVLRHMSDISASDESSTPVIEFDDDEKRLHITDPFFAFYLRWGRLASAVL